MPLIRCPECGRDNVSQSAYACPNCGFNVNGYYRDLEYKKNKPQREKRFQKVTLIIAIICGVLHLPYIIICFGALFFLPYTDIASPSSAISFLMFLFFDYVILIGFESFVVLVVGLIMHRKVSKITFRICLIESILSMLLTVTHFICLLLI